MIEGNVLEPSHRVSRSRSVGLPRAVSATSYAPDVRAASPARASSQGTITTTTDTCADAATG